MIAATFACWTVGTSMKRTVLAILLLAFPIPAFAIDHLEPERSAFDTRANLWDVEYNDMVLTNFKDLFGEGVVARMIGLPSFDHEFGVGLSVSQGEWRIVALESTRQLWAYYGSSPADIAQYHLPPDWHDVPVLRCEQPIAPALGARLANLWEQILAGTRFQEGEAVRWGADGKPQRGGEVIVGSDGATFHFSAWQMAGKTWSPPADSPPGMLVDIAGSMIDYCRHNDAKNLATMEHRAAALEQRLGGVP